jgi:hypothetical protein
MRGTRIAAVLVVLAALLGVLLVLRFREPSDSGAMSELDAAPAAPVVGVDERAVALRAADVAPLTGLPERAPREAEPLGELPPTARLTGRVTVADGAPLAGARVFLPLGRKPPVVMTVTEADGFYELEVPATAAFGVVRAEADGRAPGEAWFGIDERGTHPAKLDFVLDELVVLTGLVSWAEEGTPCAGSKVVVSGIDAGRGSAGAGKVVCETITGADGTFRGEMRGSRLVSMTVTALLESATSDTAGPGAVSGKAGAADVPAVPTSTVPAARGPPLQPITIRQVISLPAAGEQLVVVHMPRPASVTVTLNEAQHAPLTSSAEAAASSAAGMAPVDGDARAAGERPPRPPLVVLQPRDAGAETLRVPLVDHEATFAVVNPELTWDLVVRAAGHPPRIVARGLSFPAGQHSRIAFDVDELHAALPPQPQTLEAGTMMFRCRFVDESGRVLGYDEFSQRATLEGTVTGEAVSLADGSVGTVTMELHSLATMECWASVSGARPPIAMTLRLGELTLSASNIASQQTVDLVVPLPPGAATLRVLVTDGHGAARMPARAMVVRRDTHAGGVVHPREGSGELNAALAPGPYAVWAVVVTEEAGIGGTETNVVAVDLAPGEERTVTLVASAPGMLRGLVDPPPAAGESATVQAFPAAGGLPFPALGAWVGADGRFELVGLTAGDWDLACLIEGAPGGSEGASHGAIEAASGAGRRPQRVVVVRAVTVPSAGVGEVVIENRAAGTCILTLRAGDGPAPYGLDVSIAAADGSLRLVEELWPGEQIELHLPCGRYTWQRMHRGSEEPADAPPAPFELSASTPDAFVIDV